MAKADSHNFWVVVPAFNEAKYIKKVLQGIKKYTSNIIVVDDGSRDQTAELATRETKHVLRHAVNLGKGSALKTGCDYAFDVLEAEGIIMIDGDAQHDPKNIPDFLAKLSPSIPVILGIRQLSGSMPYMRRLSNSIASKLVELFYGVFVPDIPSGYKGIHKSVYSQLRWTSTGYEVELEIAMRLAKQGIPFSTIVIETIYHDMDKGMTSLEVLQVMKQVVIWRFVI